MIKLFTGDDSEKRVKAFEGFLQKSSGEVFDISRNNFDPVQLESFYSGSGLFFDKSTVVLRGLCEREETREVVLKKLADMASSSNDFIFIESKLAKPALKEFEKAGAEIFEFNVPKIKKEVFNNFLLANALGAGDKLKLWVYYRQAMDKGVTPEELAGVLFWKTKDMLSKGVFGKFKESELKKINSNLALLLPKARSFGQDSEIAFERFILESM